MFLSKVTQSITSSTKLVNDPLNFMLDGLIKIVLFMFIPLPIPDEIFIQVKGSILQIILAFFLIFIISILGLVAVISIPFSHQIAITAPVSDTSFSSTDIPLQNPLGGTGFSFAIITAYFHDPAYYAQFGTWHTGLDMIPSDSYYQNSTAYKNTSNTAKDIVIFSTMNGTVTYFQDQYGSHSVEIVNKENTLKAMYLHLNKVFVTTGQLVTAGDAIGTMGNTGFATGTHLHYEIDSNNNGSWIPVDPLGYIQ